jgi:hypothetical protein
MKKTAWILSLGCILLLGACATAAKAPVMNYSDEALRAHGDAMAGGGWAEAEAPAAAPTILSEKSDSLVQAVNPQDRIVLMDASLTLVVDDPADTASKIADMAFAKGGWVVESNITQSVYGQAGEKYFAGTISIRVPAATSDQLKSTLAEIEALAVEVKSRSMNGRDVTAEYTDAQSRLKNLRASRDRLLEIMQSAEDTEAVLAVEAQLRQVTSEIEVLEGQINYYDTAANYSLITITLQPYIPSQPIDIGGWHPEGVAKEAFETLIHGLQSLVNFFIWAGICGIPALVVVVVVASPFYLIARVLIRRHKKPIPAK